MNLQKINQAREIVNERIDEVLDFLGIEYTDHGNYYSFSCPIHGSTRKQSASVYKESGKWGCWTNSCHQDTGNTFFDFVSAYLKTQDVEKNLEQIAAFCATILKADIDNFKEIKDYNLKLDSSKLVNSLIKQRKVLQGKVLRKTIRERLYIPADYYIKRGYSMEVLDKYDVGLCNSFGKEMFGRIVVPIYDDNYSFMVGCVGRSKNSVCEKCNRYHSVNTKCPTNQIEEVWSAKWKNSKGFHAEHCLYNYWFAKSYIKKLKTVILVEGQGDVWRLEESGIHCSLGVFGDKLSDGQKLILEQSGAQNIIIASDNDEAGEQFRKKLRDKCERMFNVYDIHMSKKDFGEMTIEETKELVLPLLERLI
jgi:5S rRNA maturation endonuclease (ribonuclease M5)